MHDQTRGSSLRAGKRSARWWVAVAVLLGAGIAPCPDCGLPLAIHLWPLAVLMAIVHLIARRSRPLPDDQITPEQWTDSDVEKRELP
jgi:hypothetical protein